MKKIFLVLAVSAVLVLVCCTYKTDEQLQAENKAPREKVEKNQEQMVAKNKEDVLKEFKNRVIGSELLDELIRSYDERSKLVHPKMTIEQVFIKYCGEAEIEWEVLSAEELEKSDLGVSMGNALKLMVSMGDKETLEKTRQEINEKKYDSEVYGIKVEISKIYPVDRQKPEIRTYKEGFLFDRRDKKIKHLLLGLMNGISAIDFPIEAKGKGDWR
jgi:hypothetical protein